MPEQTNARTPQALSSGAARSLQNSGWTLGRPFGIPLVADYSLLLIFALIALNLGGGLLPLWHPQWPPWLRWGLALCASIAFFASIALHELCHALVARAQGMRVRRIQLFVFGGIAEIDGEPPSARVEFWMAIVGPLASIALGIASTWLGTQLTVAHVDADAVMADPAALGRSAGPLATLLLWLRPICSSASSISAARPPSRGRPVRSAARAPAFFSPIPPVTSSPTATSSREVARHHHHE